MPTVPGSTWAAKKAVQPGTQVASAAFTYSAIAVAGAGADVAVLLHRSALEMHVPASKNGAWDQRILNNALHLVLSPT